MCRAETLQAPSYQDRSELAGQASAMLANEGELRALPAGRRCRLS